MWRPGIMRNLRNRRTAAACVRTSDGLHQNDNGRNRGDDPVCRVACALSAPRSPSDQPLRPGDDRCSSSWVAPSVFLLASAEPVVRCAAASRPRESVADPSSNEPPQRVTFALEIARVGLKAAAEPAQPGVAARPRNLAAPHLVSARLEPPSATRHLPYHSRFISLAESSSMASHPAHQERDGT